MTESRRSRRQLLTAGVAVGTLLMAGPTALVGCASSAPPVPDEPDPLENPAQRAEHDIALALAVAGAHPAWETRAVALAADRQAHATALRGELRRVRPSPPPISSTPTTPVTATADQTAAPEALAEAMRAAQDEAAGLVTMLPGHRAALLASVAACCASHAALLA
ncbi:MAG: hypothetical protein ACRDTG_05585 [Pseudonocardiaceae bacterium]